MVDIGMIENENFCATLNPAKDAADTSISRVQLESGRAEIVTAVELYPIPFILFTMNLHLSYESKVSRFSVDSLFARRARTT